MHTKIHIKSFYTFGDYVEKKMIETPPNFQLISNKCPKLYPLKFLHFVKAYLEDSAA